jgi:hydrogenase maturation protease
LAHEAEREGTEAMKTLVLGLGNELLSDDAVGLLAVRALAREVEPGDDVEIVETALSGLALLDYFIGFDRALILDSICTGRHPAGTVTEISPSDLTAVGAPSPHFAGLPELLALARRLELKFPSEIRILAVETADPYTLGGRLTPAVEQALPELVARARAALEDGRAAGPTPPAPPRPSPPEPGRA